jgi:hypothetical protein
MKKGIIIILILIILAISWYQSRNKTVQPEQAPVITQQPATLSDSEKFEGTVTAYDTACFADGVCSVTIGNKKVILEVGGRVSDKPEPAGQLVGVASIGDLETKIGSQAEVYARKLSDTEYTVYGSSTYFVKIK